MSYAVINAIMKMKIAVVATAGQWRACKLKKRKIYCYVMVFGDCSRFLHLLNQRQLKPTRFHYRRQKSVSVSVFCFLNGVEVALVVVVGASNTSLLEWFMRRSLKNSSFESIGCSGGQAFAAEAHRKYRKLHFKCHKQGTPNALAWLQTPNHLIYARLKELSLTFK